MSQLSVGGSELEVTGFVGTAFDGAVGTCDNLATLRNGDFTGFVVKLHIVCAFFDERAIHLDVFNESYFLFVGLSKSCNTRERRDEKSNCNAINESQVNTPWVDRINYSSGELT